MANSLRRKVYQRPHYNRDPWLSYSVAEEELFHFISLNLLDVV